MCVRQRVPQLQLAQTGKVKEILAALGMYNPVPYKQITECFVQVSCFYSHRCEHTHAVDANTLFGELTGRCTDETTPVCTGGCSWEILSAHTQILCVYLCEDIRIPQSRIDCHLSLETMSSNTLQTALCSPVPGLN